MRKIDLTNLKAASSETARDINRRILLNLIRCRQPISRADLARSAGLQRSTVSAIVDLLIREGWVVEGLRGRLPIAISIGLSELAKPIAITIAIPMPIPMASSCL